MVKIKTSIHCKICTYHFYTYNFNETPNNNIRSCIIFFPNKFNEFCKPGNENDDLSHTNVLIFYKCLNLSRIFYQSGLISALSQRISNLLICRCITPYILQLIELYILKNYRFFLFMTSLLYLQRENGVKSRKHGVRRNTQMDPNGTQMDPNGTQMDPNGNQMDPNGT